MDDSSDSEMTVEARPWNDYTGSWKDYPGPFDEHAAFKFDNTSVVLRVEYITYQVHSGMLICLSPVWKDILEILSIANNDAEREGGKANPIFLEGITADEMDDFLFYIYRQLWTNRRYASVQALERSHVNLLKLASLWQIEPARAYAITYLEQNAELPIFRRLELARMYTIIHWVDGAVRDLFASRARLSDISHLSGGELSSLDFKTYTIIARAMERRMVERQRVAKVVPTMSSDPTWTCDAHSKCISAWKKLWWAKIAPKILHPDSPLPMNCIADEVEKISDIDLKNRCRDDMVQAIKGGAIGFPDEKIIEGVVRAIQAWYNSSELTMERR
ncbi:hypothetical protein C8F01DRAFT_1368983 [Mycena amicta]|nr:hypothetical protein C8F01DRAFT_1368983 [Mycena amicta]